MAIIIESIYMSKNIVSLQIKAHEVFVKPLKVLLLSKFNVKFVTKTFFFQLIRSDCTCFGH